MTKTIQGVLVARVLTVCAVVGLMVGPSFSQSKPSKVSLAAAHAEANRVGRIGQEAYVAGKLEAYLVEMRRAFAIRPDHPRFIYNTASALALNGKSDEALRLVERLAAMGLSMPVEKDDDFASIASNERFRAACVRLASNAQPSGSGETAFSIEGRGLILEGLAYDAATRSWFASSVRERMILRVDASGTTSVFADRSMGLWSVFGMVIDPKRRVLWAVTAAVPQTEDVLALDEGKSALVGFDLTTGKVVQRLEPSDGRPYSFGDVTLASSGSLYVSDSKGGALLVARPGAKSLDVLLPEGQLVSPQGLVATPDSRRLLVADYALGLCEVDLRTRAVQRVATPDSVCLLGIDGVSLNGGDLVVVQNGIRPHRVARVRMRDGLRSVEGLDVLDAADPSYDEPTLGVVVNGWFHFIANSQWSKINGKGEMEPVDAFSDTLVRKLKL